MARRPFPVRQVVDQLHHIVGEAVRSEIPTAPERSSGELICTGGASDAQVDPSGVEGLERTELLGHHQWRVIGEHDAAGTDPQGGGGVGQVGDEHRWSRARNGRHAVVLGHPEAPVTQLLYGTSQACCLGQGLGGGRTRRHGGQIEDRKRYHTSYNTDIGAKLPSR
jgi:hypothetical protein